MTSRKHQPVHPGEVLRFDFLEPMGISVYRLSKEIGVSAQHLGRVVHQTRGISDELALRLARFFGTSPGLWMGLQAQYDLDLAQDKLGRTLEKRIKPLRAA